MQDIRHQKTSGKGGFGGDTDTLPITSDYWCGIYGHDGISRAVDLRQPSTELGRIPGKMGKKSSEMVTHSRGTILIINQAMSRISVAPKVPPVEEG